MDFSCCSCSEIPKTEQIPEFVKQRDFAVPKVKKALFVCGFNTCEEFGDKMQRVDNIAPTTYLPFVTSNPKLSISFFKYRNFESIEVVANELSTCLIPDYDIIISHSMGGFLVSYVHTNIKNITQPVILLMPLIYDYNCILKIANVVETADGRKDYDIFNTNIFKKVKLGLIAPRSFLRTGTSYAEDLFSENYHKLVPVTQILQSYNFLSAGCSAKFASAFVKKENLYFFYVNNEMLNTLGKEQKDSLRTNMKERFIEIEGRHEVFNETNVCSLCKEAKWHIKCNMSTSEGIKHRDTFFSLFENLLQSLLYNKK